jgi:hypothetical protein
MARWLKTCRSLLRSSGSILCSIRLGTIRASRNSWPRPRRKRQTNNITAGAQIAQVYALRNEPEKMFEWLEHAWATHDPGVVELLTNPFLRGYKDDPRFIAFAQKIGVMPKTAAHP